MFEAEFLTMMPHTVEITNPTGRSADRGVPIYAGGVTREYRARIVGKILTIRERGEDEQTVVYDIYLQSGGDYISTEARVQLPPTDFVWSIHQPILFAVARVTDEDGHHHTKLQCGYRYHRQGQ